jgi:hypothetical protein
MAVLYILIFIMAVLLVFAALLPQSYNVEQAIIIRKALAEVRDIVADFNYYSRWAPLQLTEPDCFIEIRGLAKTAGHRCSWKGKKAGKGNVTIRAIDDRHIHFDLNIDTWKLQTRDNWYFEEWGEGETKVTLQNNGNFSYPFARFLRRVMIRRLQEGIRNGLNNLKNLCEKG